MRAAYVPPSILSRLYTPKARGGGAIPELAGWTIERFARVLSGPTVELPLPTPVGTWLSDHSED